MQIIRETAYNLPRVRSLKARNIFGFKKLALSFSPGVNLVLGGKGEGKSNLIALLSGPMRLGFMLPGEPIVFRGATRASLFVEYETFKFRYRKDGIPGGHGPLAMSSFNDMKKFLRHLSKDDCFVTELDWLVAFNRQPVPYKEVWEALLHAQCQVIATVFDTCEVPLSESGATIHRLPFRRT